jgi:EAL domain-containing protein (putative c-di-GMP-specific phosphodiesterase class I)
MKGLMWDHPRVQIQLESGCRHYQGYLFGRPMPIEQFNALLKANQ